MKLVVHVGSFSEYKRRHRLKQITLDEVFERIGLNEAMGKYI